MVMMFERGRERCRFEIDVLRRMVQMVQYWLFAGVSVAGGAYLLILWYAPTAATSTADQNVAVRDGEMSIYFNAADGQKYLFDGERHFRQSGNFWEAHNWPGFEPARYREALRSLTASK